jgi:multisubunit Na+/H+ antiporter MnhB subunit
MTTVLTRSVARILLVPIFMVAIAVLVKGYVDIGDGFAAGVIASLGIILQGAAFGADEFERLPLVRFAPVAAVVGVFLSALVAFTPVLFGEPIFRHWPHAGEHASHFGTLEFITPVIFDVGVFLVVIGFCVGSMTSISRALSRQEREQRRGEASVRSAPATSRPNGGERR